jgi:catechol 2,3-dioxygenase-like lactoylglutathione lyase family enzyme
MNIIDHLSLGVDNITQATQFYDGLLQTLQVDRIAATDGFAAYGRDSIQFLLMKPENGERYSAGNGTHICLRADSREQVDAFHHFACDNGGDCAGAPGPRPAYPIEGVYTCFVRDPFGNKLEVIYNGFNA